MKHFTLKQCAFALCLAAFLPGLSMVSNAPDVSYPIGMELATAEESGYAFTSWNTHAEYTKIYREDNGYSGERNKQMWFELPESSQGVYLKASLEDSTQAGKIIFQIDGKDRSFTDDGAIWISPTDCSISGTTQDIPFGARVTAPGVYPYTVEAYVSQNDTEPVATWEATFYFMENMPTLSVPSRIHTNSFFIDVNKGDLAENTYIEVEQEYSIAYHDGIDFSADGFTYSDGRWVSQPKQIVNEQIECHLSTQGKGAVRFCIRLKDETGTTICEERPEALYPFNPLSKDVETLQALAAQNPSCKELVDYVEQKQWNQNITELKSVRVGWSMSNPSYITSIEFIEQKEKLTLGLLAQLDSLEALWLLGNDIVAPLDLSPLSKLKEVWGLSNLTYKDVTFPANFDKTKVSGTSIIRKIGTPREDGDVEVPNNTIINLADYVGTDVAGCKMTYTWLKNWDEITLTSVAENSFKLHGEPGEWLRCEIKNDSFPNWSIQTERIYLVQGELKYDSTDVAGLRKLATDNPQNQIIQDFVAQELWKEQSWGDDSYQIWLKWTADEENNAVLTHIDLRLNDEYNPTTAPKTIDLTPFKNLIDFESNRLVYVEQIDFSQCKELQLISFSANEMKSLDVSACTKLRELHFMDGYTLSSSTLYDPTDTHTIALDSLNFKGCTQIETLRIGRTKISSLDISSLSKLTSLTIEYCPNLKTIVGLEQTHLSSLGLINTRSMYKEQIAKLDFSSITSLDYRGSDYPLPNPSSLTKLGQISFPVNVDSFDCDLYPELGWMETWFSKIKYSNVKNYKNKIGRWGRSQMEILNAKSLKWYPCVMPGDTIDLSSEAVIQDNPSTYIWVNDRGEAEEEVFMKTDKPGVFIVNPNIPIEEHNRYWCRIWNKTYSDGASADKWNWNGWVMDTEEIKVIDNAAYDEQELNMLQTIVNNSSSQGLKDWWEQGQWMLNNYYGEDEIFSIRWNENHRLQRLDIYNFKDKMTGVLNLSVAEELEQLSVQYTDISDCVFVANPKLTYISFGESKIALPIDKEFTLLQAFYPSDVQSKLDLSKLPVLSELGVYYSHLKFSDIIAPRKIEKVWGSTSWVLSDKVYWGTNYIGADEAQTIDFTSETKVGAKVQWKTWNAEGSYIDMNLPATQTGKYTITDALQKQKKIRAILTNDNYPGWSIYFDALLYTLPGDANIDGKVNVQDISATIPYVLQDYNNRLPIFGYYQADMDANQAIEVADVVGIVNTIRGVANPVMKSTFQPIVYVTSEADGKLYVDTQVPLAGLQLTFTGMEQEIPLLSEAAHFAHAAHATDSLRMVAYSMDGSTIPAGRTLLAQLPKGATLVEALFADANAQSLKADLTGIVTATEEIWGDMAAEQVANYPNPLRGQTNFTYGVQGQADQAVIRIYTANGSLAQVLTGLPVAPGENQYRATVDLPAGLYLYRLEISRSGRVISTQTNNLIIK